MPRPELHTVPEFYHRYINLVTEDEVVTAIENNSERSIAYLQAIPPEKWTYRYAEGKWTIKEMIQHVIDADRIFSYRALCIARGETQSLPGFDENAYAERSESDRRDRAELLEEFSVLRKSISQLFRSFSAGQLSRTGKANNNPISVNGIGFILAGHMQHHVNILAERYLTENPS